MRTSRMKPFLVAVLSTLLGVGCPSSDSSLEETARHWQDAVNAKNVDVLMTYFADDSVAFYPRPRPSLSKTVIRDNWTDFYHQKNATHPITTEGVATSSSADFGHVIGNWQASYDDEGGHQTGGGRYLAVWRRSPNGPWRIVAISANEYEEDKK